MNKSSYSLHSSPSKIDYFPFDFTILSWSDALKALLLSFSLRRPPPGSWQRLDLTLWLWRWHPAEMSCFSCGERMCEFCSTSAFASWLGKSSKSLFSTLGHFCAQLIYCFLDWKPVKLGLGKSGTVPRLCDVAFIRDWRVIFPVIFPDGGCGALQ